MSCTTDNLNHPLTDDTTALLKEVDRCVACGLCLDSCPTYAVTQVEGHSPRGRILLASGLASKRLAYSEQAREYLQACLHCGICEQVCPANVAYGKIIDRSKSLLLEHKLLKPVPAWLRLLLDYPRWRNLLGVVVEIWQRSGLQRLFRKYRLLQSLGATGLARFEAMLPTSIARRTHTISGQQRVQLFSGCVGALVERPTLVAAQGLLEMSGYTVETSRAQGCCGALYQHNGEISKAQQCLQDNALQLNDIPLISCASGCGAHWKQFAPAADQHDIMDFLWGCTALEFEPLEATVALHAPCTAKNALHDSDAPLKMLSKIAGLKVQMMADEVSGSQECCGAGGVDILQASDIASQLMDAKIEALKETGANMLLTTNTGCAMHFRRALHHRKMDIPVIHPCVLLYQTMQVSNRKLKR